MTQEQIGARRVLHPGKLKWSMVTMIGLLFVAGGIFVITQGDGSMVIWLSMLFFVPVAGVGLMMLIGIGSSLTLDTDGFHVLALGRDQGKMRWQDCSSFGVARIGRNTLVTYNRIQDEGKKIATLNRSIAGGSAVLGDTYGMKAVDLANLMNAYRDKALMQGPP